MMFGKRLNLPRRHVGEHLARLPKKYQSFVNTTSASKFQPAKHHLHYQASPAATMSAEKRPASDAFGSSQLVVKRPNLGNNSKTVAVVNGSGGNGAFIQTVCTPLGKHKLWSTPCAEPIILTAM
jgi:hypothetical protein